MNLLQRKGVCVKNIENNESHSLKNKIPKVKCKYKDDIVSSLHKALCELGFDIADNELRESRFGKSTFHAIKMFQKKNNIELIDEVNEKTATKEELKAIQRIHSVAPNLDTAINLLNQGINSAYQIAELPEQTFISNFGSCFVNIIEGKKTYYKAVIIDFLSKY